MTDDVVELRRFVETGDEAAFGELVARHFNLVYGTALRQTNGDAGLAEDVAQAVFTDLARKAGMMSRRVVLAGWLYEAARFAGARAVRTEQRRRSRERAFSMQDNSPEISPDWERIRPVLEAAMGQLKSGDRNAVLLHYFEGRDFRAVGAALGLSDDAAQKRVSRALDKLRVILTRGGTAVSGAALTTFLGTAAMAAPPAGLALSVAKTSLTGAKAAGPPGLMEALRHYLAPVKVQLAAALLILLSGGVAAYLVFHPAAGGTFITADLSPYYNGELDKSWTPDYGNNHLAALGKGRRVLKRVPFDIGGVVQLEGVEWRQRGYKFPEGVEGIRIGANGRRIHLLHANSAKEDPPGTIVASLILNYADGGQTRFAIRQGVEVLDWWEWPRAQVKRPTDANTVVAWSGGNPAAEHQGARIRLFDTVFVNPHPEKEIRTIDYTSTMAGSGPFMVALTIEN
jgi:RNA polymerase sigma factor (sigma-70 family)